MDSETKIRINYALTKHSAINQALHIIARHNHRKLFLSFLFQLYNNKITVYKFNDLSSKTQNQKFSERAHKQKEFVLFEKFVVFYLHITYVW